MHRRADQLPHRPDFPGLPPTSPIGVPRTGIHNVSIHSWDLQSPRPTLPWQTSHQIKNLIQLRVAFADKKLKVEAALCGQWHHACASFSGYYKSSNLPHVQQLNTTPLQSHTSFLTEVQKEFASTDYTSQPCIQSTTLESLKILMSHARTWPLVWLWAPPRRLPC